MSDKLKMTFDPRTIEHLGIKMYSTLPPAIAELIANAYDACASEVLVKLSDNPKKIEVIDNGTGMTFDEVNEYFLKIGRNRRAESQKPPCDRFPTGKKGLGKLALFGIGRKIEVITKKEGEKIGFVMDWDEIMSTGGVYEPKFEKDSCSADEHGTTIVVHDLKRKTGFDLESHAVSIAKLFNFNDESFHIKLILNGNNEIEIDRDLKFKGITKQFEWTVPDDVKMLLSDEEYEHLNDVQGKLFTSEKPLKPGLRGITLYADGRMVNLPEFFGVSESSHFFSYLTGYLDIDFVDKWDEDVISTDRQSLDWDHEKLQSLSAFLQRIIMAISKDWREKRKKEKDKKVQESTGIDIENWLEKTPRDIKQKLNTVISTLTDRDVEMPIEKQKEVVETIHELVPEYPYYHWRHLHDAIHRVSKDDYEKSDYFRAAEDAVKEYENIVKKISSINDKIGTALMRAAYAPECSSSPINITDCTSTTHKNIEEGQQNLSVGLISGFRNPVAHEPKTDIHPSLFNDKDCLDILSLTSYLLNKLDQRVKPPIEDSEETES